MTGFRYYQSKMRHFVFERKIFKIRFSYCSMTSHSKHFLLNIHQKQNCDTLLQLGQYFISILDTFCYSLYLLQGSRMYSLTGLTLTRSKFNQVKGFSDLRLAQFSKTFKYRLSFHKYFKSNKVLKH